jgi:hypothetical protein
MLLRRVTEHFGSQKWTAIALDLLIVFVGIFGAFQVDRWNEERLLRLVENAHLIALAEDFAANQTSLQDVIDTNQGSVNAALALLEYQTGDPIEMGHDTFYSLLRAVQSLGNWAPRRRAYDVLVASGEISVLQDERLKSELAAYFADVDRAGERRNEMIMQRTTSLQPYVNANLDNAALVAKADPEIFGTLSPSLPLDQFESVLGTGEFEGVITTKMHSSYDAILYYGRLLDLNNEIESRLADLLQIH